MTPSPPTDVALRLATPADVRSLAVLGTQVFLDTYAPRGIRPSMADEVLEYFSLDAIAALLARPAAAFLLAESAGHLIGFAQLQRGARPPRGDFEDAVELERLYVQERATGRGVGRRLLQEAERWAGSGGASMLWLTAWVGNLRALGFYAAQGYADVGQTFYDFQGELFENRIFEKTFGRR